MYTTSSREANLSFDRLSCRSASLSLCILVPFGRLLSRLYGHLEASYKASSTREGSWLTCHCTMPPDSFMHIAGYSYWPIYIQIVSASVYTTSGCATLPASFHDIRLHTAFVQQQCFDVTTSEQCSSYQGLTHLSSQFK